MGAFIAQPYAKQTLFWTAVSLLQVTHQTHMIRRHYVLLLKAPLGALCAA